MRRETVSENRFIRIDSFIPLFRELLRNTGGPD